MSDYETRVRALEAKGLTRSDAQAVVDAEEMRPTLPIKSQWLMSVWHLEEAMRDEIMECIELAEALVEKTGGQYDDYVVQDDGTKQGVIYPENAAPELDTAVSMLQDVAAELLDCMTKEEKILAREVYHK